MQYRNTKIVLVTNSKTPPTSGYRRHMARWDITMTITNYMLAKAIKENGYPLTVYSTINDFIKNIDRHKNDLVFPYHHRVASKIRQSFVQTFCESYNIKYIGGDAYSQTIANDKVLAKEICRLNNINSPNCKIFFDTNFPPDILSLKLPLIVKPQFEGDSIGISKKNIFNTYEGVISFAAKLMEDLNFPVIIEEFIEGKEISVCIIGYKNFINKIGVVELIKQPSDIQSYYSKKFFLNFNKHKDAMSLLSQDNINKITSTFNMLDKVEFMRMDFILNNNSLFNIEMGPDPTLSPLSAMFAPFKNQMTFTEFVNLIIMNCIERYQTLGEL